jgi:hypothetical protein
MRGVAAISVQQLQELGWRIFADLESDSGHILIHCSECKGQKKDCEPNAGICPLIRVSGQPPAEDDHPTRSKLASKMKVVIEATLQRDQLLGIFGKDVVETNPQAANDTYLQRLADYQSLSRPVFTSSTAFTLDENTRTFLNYFREIERLCAEIKVLIPCEDEFRQKRTSRMLPLEVPAHLRHEGVLEENVYEAYENLAEAYQQLQAGISLNLPVFQFESMNTDRQILVTLESIRDRLETGELKLQTIRVPHLWSSEG